MVNQNFILYINEKQILRQASCSVSSSLLSTGETKITVKTEIPEKHLVCGFVFEGLVLKSNQVKNFPFQAIEKYLFEASNIQFVVPDLELSQSNKSYNFDFFRSEIYPVQTVEILDNSVPAFDVVPPAEDNPPADNQGGSVGDGFVDPFRNNYPLFNALGQPDGQSILQIAFPQPVQSVYYVVVFGFNGEQTVINQPINVGDQNFEYRLPFSPEKVVFSFGSYSSEQFEIYPQ